MKKRKFVNGGGISARKKNRSIRRHVKKGKKAPVTKGQVRDVNSSRISVRRTWKMCRRNIRHIWELRLKRIR